MIKHWEKKNRNMDVVFSSILLCFLIALIIDFYIKQTGDKDLLKIFMSSFFIAIGFAIMLYDTVFNAKWFFGFWCVLFMFLFTFSVAINNLVRFLKNDNNQNETKENLTDLHSLCRI